MSNWKLAVSETLNVSHLDSGFSTIRLQLTGDFQMQLQIYSKGKILKIPDIWDICSNSPSFFKNTTLVG